jgi:hypothetical protein
LSSRIARRQQVAGPASREPIDDAPNLLWRYALLPQRP